MEERISNSEGEVAAIQQRMLRGTPVHILVLFDDPPSKGGSGQGVPMLLDRGFATWLVERIKELYPDI